MTKRTSNSNYSVPRFFEGDSNIDFIINPEKTVGRKRHWFVSGNAVELAKRERARKCARVFAEILGTLLLVVAIIGLVLLIGTIKTPAHAEGAYMSYSALTDDYQDWSSELIREIQTALNDKMARVSGYKKIPVDGILGPGTDKAIKLFQRKNDLVVDGICGKNTLKALGIEDTGEHPRYAPNLYESFEQSTNGVAAHLNLNSHLLEVYEKIDGEWYLVRVMSCATGSIKNNTMTAVRNKVLNGSGHSAIYGKNGNREWAGDNAVAIGGGDFFHSVLRWRKAGGKWKRDDNSALGTFCSHGCVRLDLEDSKWVKQHFTKGTALVIDNRSWDLSTYANGGTIVNK